MKVVSILRWSGAEAQREYSDRIPKPMVEIGYRPLLVACHEILREFRSQRLHSMPRLPWRHRKEIFSGLQRMPSRMISFSRRAEKH